MLIDLIVASPELYQRFLGAQADFIILYSFNKTALSQSIEALQPIFEAICPLSNCDQDLIIPSRDRLLTLLVSIAVSNSTHPTIARSIIDWLKGVCDDVNHNTTLVLKTIGVYPILTMLALWLLSEEKAPKALSLENPSDVEIALRSSSNRVPSPAVSKTAMGYDNRGNLLHSSANVTAKVKSLSPSFEASVRQEYQRRVADIESRSRLQLSCGLYLKQLITGTSGHESLSTTEIDSSLLCTPSGFTLAHFQTLLNFIQTCYTRLGQLEDQSGGSKAHTAVLQHIIMAKGSTKQPFSSSNPTLLKPTTSPTTQMDKPESRLLTAIVITLDAIIGAAETALGPIVLSFMRALQANYTVWNLCMHLLGSPYGSIRYRAIALLTLSLSAPPHGLEPDAKALALFEKPFNGFQVMVEQLSKHPSDDAIVQSLLSIMYWRRSRSNPLKSQLSTGTMAPGSEVFAGLGLSGEVGLTNLKSPLPADKTRVRESTLIKSPSLNQLEARGMVQSGISTAKDVIMRVKSSDSNTSGSAGDAKAKPVGDKTIKVAPDSPEQSLRSRTQSQTTGAQSSSLFSIFTWKSAAPPGKVEAAGAVDGDDLKDSAQFEGDITLDQSALSPVVAKPPVVDTVERRRSYSSSFHLPTADNRRRGSYEPRRDPPTEPSNNRLRPLSLDIHALPAEGSSAEGSVTSAQGEQGVEYCDAEIIRVPQIFPALIAALQTCRSLDVVQSAVKTIVLSVDANVKSSRTINPTTTTRLSTNMDLLLLTCKDWIIHIAAAIQYKREKILGNKSVHAGDADGDGKADSSSATSDVNGGGDRLNSPRRITHGESFSESHDNFISEASTGISASEDELEESISRSLYGDSAIDCSESVKSFTTRGGKHYSRHNTKPIDHLETLYNRFVEPFYLLIDVFIAIDMRKKPSPTRLCTEVFRLSVPEYEDIQCTILYNILKSLDNFPFNTQQYTTDIIIDYLKSYIYLLESIFYKCDILLEFTVMTIKVLYNINYKCLPDIRIRLKEIGIIDIKNIYIIQCLMDCFDSNSRDLYNRVIALCEINTSLQGYITSTDTKTTTLMSNNHVILYILSIFIEAAEELEAVSVVESNFFHSDSNKELIEKVEMLINATYIIIAIIQSCVTFSQECKNVVRKLTKNVIGDNKDYLMTILLKSEPLSLPDFSTDATSGGGGGGSVHGTGRETMSTLDMFMSSSFKRADSERSGRSSSGDEEERVPTPTVPLYSAHALPGSTPQSPSAAQATSSWWGWSSASAPATEPTKIAAAASSGPAEPAVEPPPAPVNPTQMPSEEAVKDTTTIRANDIPDFLEWFCASEQRRVFTEFKARVIKEIKPILKKMEKTYDRNIQRKVKHIKGEMDKLSKDRAASDKLLKEHKDKVQKHTDKAIIWYEQESSQHIEKVNMNLRQGKETLQSELESLRKRYTSTGGTSSCDSASQKGDDTTSSSEGPDSPHSTCPSPSPLPSQQSAPLLLKQIQQYFARGVDNPMTDPLSTSSSTDSRGSHSGGGNGGSGGVLTSSRNSKIPAKTNDTTNNTNNIHKDDSQAVRSSLTDKGAEKGTGAVEKRENPLHIYEVILAYMQQS